MFGKRKNNNDGKLKISLNEVNASDKEENEGTKNQQLGQGYYLTYDMDSNMMGGYHPVNIVLKNSNDEKCNYRITDKLGNFVNFPGVKSGNWEKSLMVNSMLR